MSTINGTTLSDFEDGAVGDALASLLFRDGQTHAYIITEMAVIVDILKTVPLGQVCTDFGISDADIDFLFQRESGAALGLRFITADFFGIRHDGTSVYYTVLAPERVRYCLDLALWGRPHGRVCCGYNIQKPPQAEMNCPRLCRQYKKTPMVEILSFQATNWLRFSSGVSFVLSCSRSLL